MRVAGDDGTGVEGKAMREFINNCNRLLSKKEPKSREIGLEMANIPLLYEGTLISHCFSNLFWSTIKINTMLRPLVKCTELLILLHKV